MLELVQTWHPEPYAEENLNQIDVTDSAEDSKIGPTTYSHVILNNESARLDVSLNYFENESADFPVPETFEDESDPRLTSVQVTPHEQNWNFGVTVTKLDNNVTLADSVEPLAGYRITPHGMWPDALKTMSVSAELNTSRSTKNVSAEDITAYTNRGGNWSEVDVRTNTTNETITIRVDSSTYTSIYFARNSNASTTSSTIELTVTENNTSTNTTATDLETATQSTEQLTTVSLTSTTTESQPATSAPQTTTEMTGTTIPGFSALTAMISLSLVGVLLYGRQHANN